MLPKDKKCLPISESRRICGPHLHLVGEILCNAMLFSCFRALEKYSSSLFVHLFVMHWSQQRSWQMQCRHQVTKNNKKLTQEIDGIILSFLYSTFISYNSDILVSNLWWIVALLYSYWHWYYMLYWYLCLFFLIRYLLTAILWFHRMKEKMHLKQLLKLD